MSASTASVAAQNDLILKRAEHVGPHLPLHAVTNRGFQGISSMAVTPGGRLWATWYAGKTPGEDHNNYVVLTTSGDDGRTWNEVLIADPDQDGPVRTFDPELWMAPDGKLRWFWAQSVGHDGTVGGVWCVEIANPESDQPEYSDAMRVTDGVMMCKPIVLTTGEWVLPASTWRKTDNSAKFVVSTDQGKTWTVRGGCHVPKDVRSFDEHMFVERKDGSIWLLVRTEYGMGESVSTDRGVTWPVLEPSDIAHTCSRFYITRLQSGNLLLVKHGPVKTKTGRSHLTAFISTDDGKTWGGGLMLDERGGISYPDGQQAADGTIYITYDFSRTGKRHILMCTFREEDAAAGKAITDSVRLRVLISEGSGGIEKKDLPPPPKRDNKDGVALRTAPAGALAIDGVDGQPFTIGETLFTDRGYTVVERPDVFDGARFLRTTIEGPKKARCTRAGMVFVLTPMPGRNADSQADSLVKQGFNKVALPETSLFAPLTGANYCTLYQKECTEGEAITFGKWAVPVFAKE